MFHIVRLRVKKEKAIYCIKNISPSFADLHPKLTTSYMFHKHQPGLRQRCRAPYAAPKVGLIWQQPNLILLSELVFLLKILQVGSKGQFMDTVL